MAQEEVSRLAETVRHHSVIRLEPLTKIAAGIVQSLQSSDRLVVQALSGANGSPLITNLVNVSILSTKLGTGLEYRQEELERLALAGLLHDIGIFAVPESLVLKPHRLTPNERAIIEQHPELGYQVLSTLGSSYSWLAQVVQQAHERWKGQGYPNKLKGSQIHDYAQIIGIVDIFDALISPRPYRRRILPHEAVRELLVAEQSSFSRELIKALVEQLSVYPLGTTVRLNTGEVGVVTQLNSRYPLRPVVQMGQTANRPVPNGPRLADLSKTPLVYIVETLEAPTIENWRPRCRRLCLRRLLQKMSPRRSHSRPCWKAWMPSLARSSTWWRGRWARPANQRRPNEGTRSSPNRPPSIAPTIHFKRKS